MSKATAEDLARARGSGSAGANPDQDVGSAVLGILNSAAAISRVKERNAAFDQRELMDLIDREVGAVRAGRPRH